MAAGLRELFERSPRRGVLLLMSDFLADDLEQAFSVVRLFRHRGWEVVALHLIHPDEERLPEGVAFRFENMEEAGYVDCTPIDVRETYRKRFATHVATVRRMSLTIGCDYRRISTSVSYLRTLGGFLVERVG